MGAIGATCCISRRRSQYPRGHDLRCSGSRTTASPSRRIRTSSPGNRNSFGRRTACDRPLRNSFAVAAFPMVSPSWYISVYTKPSRPRHFEKDLMVRCLVGRLRKEWLSYFPARPRCAQKALPPTLYGTRECRVSRFRARGALGCEMRPSFSEPVKVAIAGRSRSFHSKEYP
jgi:hypothetical protein